MLKKSLVIVSVIFLLGFLYVGASVIFSGDEETPPAAEPREAKISKWSGRANKIVGTRITEKGKQIDILGIRFADLNRKKARLTVLMKINQTARPPDWVKKPGAFTGARGVNTSIKPGVVVGQKGSETNVRVSFKNVPIGSLGQTCAGEALEPYGTPTAPLYLQLNGLSRSPDKLISTALLAPDAPIGHCLGRGGAFRPSVKITGFRASGSGKTRLVVLTGVARTNTKTVNVKVGARRVARPRVQGKSKKFRARFKTKPGQSKLVIRIGTNKNPALATKRVTLKIQKKN